MALSENKTVVQNFTGGLVTDFHELNVPQSPQGANYTVGEANCDLHRKGFRQRRMGIAYEEGYTQNGPQYDPLTMAQNYLKSYRWDTVNNDAKVNFLIVQTGALLSFYDLSFAPLSAGLKSFTINLDTYAAPSVVSTATEGVSIASGNGVLFVVGPLIDPFYVTYNPDTDTIAVTPINIQIRDLVEQDISAAPDVRLASITSAREYDLFNQGWNTNNIRLYYYNKGPTVEAGATTVLQYYLSVEHVYPPKTGPWWIGKRIGDKGIEVFDPYQFDSVMTGNTLGSLGHYIVNAFNIDRSAASGIGGLPVVSTNERPTCVAFFAGKVFYALGNTIYYSQTITNTKDLSGIGKCYQEADPTSEQVNNLIATDGGTITISQSASPMAFFVIENSLIYFSTNGTWIISGGATNSGFSATDYSINKISDVSCSSARTIINADGIPIWWAPQGIFTLKPTPAKQSFAVESISLKRIQNYYDGIVPLARKNATGCYDHIQKRCIWLFKSTPSQDDTNRRFYYNDMLILDLLFDAYIPYEISDLNVPQSSKICDVFNIQQVQTSTEVAAVTDNAGNVVVDGTGAIVTTDVNSLFNSSTITHDTNYLVVGPLGVSGSTGNTEMTPAFADFTSCDFLDWSDYTTVGLGADYTSYLDVSYTISGYMSPHFTPQYDAMMWMYSPYIYVYLDQPARACESTSITIPGTPPTTTTNKIMAYYTTDTYANDTIAKHMMVVDYINKTHIQFVHDTQHSTTLIRKYDMLSSGEEIAHTDTVTLGLGITNSLESALGLSYNGYLVWADSGSNSPQINCLDAETLSQLTIFGTNTSHLGADATHAGSIYSAAALRWGSTDYVVTTALYVDGPYVEAYTTPGMVHTVIGRTDEAQPVVTRGAIGTTSGTAFVLGRPKSIQYPSTAGFGIYQVTASASGLTMAKKGTVLPTAVDATWTHYTNILGPAYDQADGNLLFYVQTADSVVNKQYIIKVASQTAAVLWVIPTAGMELVTDTSLTKANITQSKFFYLDFDSVLYTIDTAAGTATTEVIDFLEPCATQISDDASVSLFLSGLACSWTPETTTPTYIGTYMGTLGNHTISSNTYDLRWFQGGVSVGGTADQIIYTKIDVPNASSCLMQACWDWASSSASKKWSQQVETYKYRANFFVATSKNKVRGKGKALQLRFSSTMGKDFNLIGWGIWYTKNQHP